MLLLLAAPAAEPVQWAQMTIERRVIIRVPMARKGKAPPRADPHARDDWDEKKGPRCIALRSIRSASIIVREGVDLLLADQHRRRSIPRDTRLTAQQKARLRRVLQASDAAFDGATQKQIAEVLFRTGRLDRDEWQVSSARFAVSSLLREGRDLIAGGYRKLLRHQRRL